jgi:predicted RND superfamily exporter protein
MVEKVLKLGENYYGDEAHLAGAQVSEYDLKVTTQADSGRVKLFSLITIALVLMVMFRSLSIPLIVLIPIEIAIWINMAVPYFAGQNLNYIGYLVIDAVQLGASVDYAIIFTREYLEQRRALPPLKAAKAAISRAAIMIITSALILTVAGLSIFFIASNTIISEIGMLVGRGAFISMLMMFTLLPLLFALCDWIVRHTSLGMGVGSFKKRG